MARQPWIVTGLQKTADAVSPGVPAGNVAFSLVAFTLLYALLMALDIKLLARYGTKDPAEGKADEPALETA